MAFDSPTLIWCIVFPAVVATAAAIICWWISRRAARIGKADSVGSIAITSAILAFAWWLSVAMNIGRFDLAGFWPDDLAGFWPDDLAGFWPDDAWARMIWPLLASVFFACLLSITTLRSRPGMWLVVGCLAVICAALVMPSGDAWTDVMPLHRPWIALITIAVTFNTMALYGLVDRNSDRWIPAVILAGLACPAVIGAATYGALFQICLAAMATTLVTAVFTAYGLIPSGSALIFPSMLFAASMIAAGRFYSYDDVPLSVYALAIFAPGIVAWSDRFVVTRSVPVRVSVAGFVAISIVMWMAYRFLIA